MTTNEKLQSKIDSLLWVEPHTASAANPDRELSYGERAVGLKFNPGGNPQVYSVKSKIGNMIDALHLISENSDNDGQKKICEIAITELQTAQMWTVKALTFSQD